MLVMMGCDREESLREMSDRVFEMDRELLERAQEMLLDCPCENGCPGCVGAAVANDGKHILRDLLTRILAGQTAE